MPEEEHTSVKLKIFLVAVLIFICAALALYSYNIINSNREYINEESAKSNDCLNTDFEVISAEYKENSISVLVKNKPASDFSIKTVNIILENITLTKETTISIGMQDYVLFENINEEYEAVLVYPNNCEKYAKTVYITTIQNT